MKQLNRFLSLSLAAAFYLTISRSADAYIDAGSGSYLLQILFASVLGAAFTAKTAFRHMRASIASKFRNVKTDDSAANAR